MAVPAGLRVSHTKEATGAVLPEAFAVVVRYAVNSETRQAAVRAALYATQAAHDAGKEPEDHLEFIVLGEGFDAIEARLLEPIYARLATLLPGAVEVPAAAPEPG